MSTPFHCTINTCTFDTILISTQSNKVRNQVNYSKAITKINTSTPFHCTINTCTFDTFLISTQSNNVHNPVQITQRPSLKSTCPLHSTVPSAFAQIWVSTLAIQVDVISQLPVRPHSDINIPDMILAQINRQLMLNNLVTSLTLCVPPHKISNLIDFLKMTQTKLNDLYF